ncbi:hypothetical protein Ancab_003470 [Ancistrocladus abbreviatus]
MGLQGSINTRIGGWSTRGISGGQKRRVSICIEILTRPPLLFLDEPTSGLDSATSYHVMSRIIKLAQRDARTVIASIHQPSGELFDLNGFPCLSFRNPSDYYLRTINNDFESDIEQAHEGGRSTEQAIEILVKSYKLSEAYQQVQDLVSVIRKQAFAITGGLNHLMEKVALN